MQHFCYKCQLNTCDIGKVGENRKKSENISCSGLPKCLCGCTKKNEFISERKIELFTELRQGAANDMPKSEEDQSHASGEVIATTLSQETLFQIHGLDINLLPLSCDFCPSKFHDLMLFDAHMATHKESRLFSCQLCSNTYVSWGNLVAHRKACHRGEVLSCDACGQRKYHPGLGPVNFPVGDSPIGCEECGEGFATVMQLYRHYRVHGTHQLMPHKDKLTKITEDEPLLGYCCPVCSASYVTPVELADHVAMLTNDNTCYTCGVCEAKLCNAELLAQHKRSHCASVIGRHVCPVCNKVLHSRPSFRRHCLTHRYREHDLCCQNCDQMFLEKKHLLPDDMQTCSAWPAGKEIRFESCHVTKDDKHSVTCPVCHKLFSRPTALNRHLKLHSPVIRRHVCEVCGEIIVHRGQLLEHARQHYGNDLPESYKKLVSMPSARRSFICEYCGREFNKKLNLQLHVRRHTGERPYGCQLCGKAFYTNQQLAIHIRHHTGERPYACGICPKAFTGPTALYVHRKLHNKVKRHICPHCGKRFSWRSAFVGHVRLHTGERPYRCTICNKAFTLKGKLNLHLKKHAAEHAILACSDCGENFGSEAELNAHRDEQCCVTMMTFVEEGPSGEKDTHVIVVNTEDLERYNIYVDDNEVVQLVV